MILQHVNSSFANHSDFATPHFKNEDATQRDDTGAVDNSLEEAVHQEREYVRQNLREELKREPTEEELDEWLRQHTEGY